MVSRWDNLTGTSSNGMIPTRKVVTSSICVIMTSNRMKPRSAFFTSSDMLLMNRRFDDVYILDGRTSRGRKLRLVFQNKGNGLVRVFTGWDLELKKRR
jgi:hypothetical protein